MVEKKFVVSVSLSIKEVDEGCCKLNEFCDSNITYSNMSYLDVVELEQLMLGMIGQMGEKGVEKAAAMR